MLYASSSGRKSYVRHRGLAAGCDPRIDVRIYGLRRTWNVSARKGHMVTPYGEVIQTCTVPPDQILVRKVNTRGRKITPLAKIHGGIECITIDEA